MGVSLGCGSPRGRTGGEEVASTPHFEKTVCLTPRRQGPHLMTSLPASLDHSRDSGHGCEMSEGGGQFFSVNTGMCLKIKPVQRQEHNLFKPTEAASHSVSNALSCGFAVRGPQK